MTAPMLCFCFGLYFLKVFAAFFFPTSLIDDFLASCDFSGPI